MTSHALTHQAIGAPLQRPVQTALHFTIEHFLLLPVGGLIALIWANTDDSYFGFAHRLSFAVNEIGMALFFALIAQEVYEEVMPGGALHTWRRWTLPVIAAVGGLAGSAVAYLAWVQWRHELLLAPGWPVAAAIDMAFAYFVVKAIFRRHPAVPFLLVLAITANGLGLIAVASRQAFVDVQPGGTALMAAAIGLAWMLRRFRVPHVWPYFAVCGVLSWWALYLDGFHPALALVPIVPFLPHAPRGLDMFADPPRPLNAARQLEHLWKYPVHVVLFLFGLVNAGVALQGYDTGTWALLVAALAGKPLGILAAIAIAVRLGALHMPARLHWRDLAVIAVATSGGFAFGLFFATAVFPTGAALTQLKLGAVVSGVGVPLAFLLARWLRVGRFHTHPQHAHVHHR